MSTISRSDVRQAVSQFNEELKREVDQIRADSRFTVGGRTQELAKALLKHRQRAESLRDSYRSEIEDSRAGLQRKLFGMPAGSDPAAMMTYRDAVDRVSQLKSPIAISDMLGRALDNGDDILARAAAGQAHRYGMKTIVDKYATATGRGAELDELDSLRGGNENVENLLFLVPAPSELRGFGDAQIRRVAEGTDE